MGKKQTAVQWLEKSLKENIKQIVLNLDAELMESLFEQALQMEREQIISAAADHCYPTHQIALNDAEIYYKQHYTQTFKP